MTAAPIVLFTPAALSAACLPSTFNVLQMQSLYEGELKTRNYNIYLKNASSWAAIIQAQILGGNNVSH